MNAAAGSGVDVAALVARVEALERRVAELEGGGGRTRRGSGIGSASAGGSGGGAVVAAGSWTRPYEVAELEVAETWIEMHEQSARPQLQRLVRQVVQAEGPVTDRLVLDRVRRAWGLKRAGGRVQEAFDQAVRQLLARALVERDADALVVPGSHDVHVRVPTEDEATRRAAEDVPLVELVEALTRMAGELGRGGATEDELTMHVAKLFGWTRRGGAIQERLDAAVRRGIDAGVLGRQGGRVLAATGAAGTGTSARASRDA